jgi:predicted kinase
MAELEIPDPSCVLLVGAAGSGKSTFAARHFPPGSILSSDALRAAIGTGEADQAVSRTAFAALHRTLDRRLAAGRLTVVDATNATAAARLAIRRVAARHGVPIVAIVFDLPEAIIRDRNAGRAGRRVPEEVVTRQLTSLNRALETGMIVSEGYGLIARLRTPGEVDRVVLRIGSQRVRLNGPDLA